MLALTAAGAAVAVVAGVDRGAAGSEAGIPGFSARVSAPPQIQRVGATYYFRMLVRTGSRPVPNLCIDFEDDGNSWLIEVPGLRAYDDDVFCFGRLRAHVARKTLTAKLVPAKTGQHKLEVGVGNAKIYATANNALLADGSLYWSRSFVLVG